jgi:hypothetical protein
MPDLKNSDLPHIPTWKNRKGILLLGVTASSLIYFSRFWFLFLPVNVFAKLSWIFQTLHQVLHNLLPRARVPSSALFIPVYIIFLILFALIVWISVFIIYKLAKYIRARSWPVVIGFVFISLFLGWMLWPTACDTHESFTDIPNQICTCTGFTFSFYPPWVFADGTSTDYCVGWERPILP